MIRGFEVVTENHQQYPNVEHKIPTRATEGSACYDFYSPVSIKIYPGDHAMISTDIKAYMLKDEVLHMYTRSGNGSKRGIKMRNQVGVIDSDYYGNIENDGNISVCVENTGDKPFEIKEGDRIAQGEFAKILYADNDIVIKKERKGGHGSTGN